MGLPIQLHAQWYDPAKVSSKVAELNEKAYTAAEEGRYREAIGLLNQAIHADNRFVDGYLSRAGIYASLKLYDSSVADFEKSLSLDSLYASVFLLPYSISLAGTGQFANALTAVNQFLATPTLNERSRQAGEFRKKTYSFALAYEQEHPSGSYVFAPQNLGDSVNSMYPEYYPSLTIDGSKLIFTRRVKQDEDFYESTRTEGAWQAAQPLSGRVNTNFNEGAQSISQDGNWIIFTGCNYPEGQGSCDLYISYRTNTGWSEAENLGAIVNTDFWESAPSLSPDKKELYFSSNQAGGYGGKDIWVSRRTAQGRWSRPENLGPTVNTKGDESCPFMYPDNQTLFFNSDGHPGYGSTDLYLSRKQPDSSWSTPLNLGYPINTIDGEGSLIVAADGKTAYYASEGKHCRGGLDLYSFELREDIRPPRTLWVKGQVTDVRTRKGLPSSVELTDITGNRIISRVQTDEDGHYLTTLPVGKEYAFNVNRKGYLFYSENYNISDHPTDSFFTADIALQPLEPGASVILRNIFFDTKQSALKPASVAELNQVLQLLTENPRLKLLISGHTDNIGKAGDNQALSNARALAVMNHLLSSRLIGRDRLQSRGLGATKPIADNTSEAGRARNRRTELTVISNQ